MAVEGVQLGVDFGTSNTVAVLRWPDGRARPLLFDGSPLLPSAVYAEPGGGLIVGRDAVHSARLEPARFEPNPKRRVDDGTVLLGDRDIPVGELITAVLARVEEERRRAAGDAPVDTTLTCPASWGATRRLILADAARAAGFGEVRLVAEPVAAATYFTRVLGREVPIGSVVVVHDFGAGTFDASVVARTSSGFEVLAVDGRDDIGGLDVDQVLVNRLGEVCAARDAAAWQRLLQPATVEDRRARRLLWDDARVAKERLSRATTADVTVPLLGIDVHLTRDELEELAKPLLEQTVRVTQSVMRWAKLAEGRVAGVFLVGGSSRIPLVATLLHRAIGEAPFAIEQPELVVAEGSMLATGAGAAPAAGSGAAPATAPATGTPVSGIPVAGSPAAGAAPVAPRPVGRATVPGTQSPTASASAPVSGVPGVSPAVAGSASGVASTAPGVASTAPTAPISAPNSPSTAPISAPISAPNFAPNSAPPAPLPGPVQPDAGRAGRVAQPLAPTRAMPRFEPTDPSPAVGRRPVPAPPVSPAPLYAAPPVSPAPVYAAPPVSPAPVYAAPQGSPAPVYAAPPVSPAPVPAPAAAVPVAGARPAPQAGRGPFARALVTLFVLGFLAAVPVVAAYVSYKLTVGEPVLPVDVDLLRRALRRLKG